MKKNNLGISTRIMCLFMSLSLFIVSCNVNQNPYNVPINEFDNTLEKSSDYYGSSISDIEEIITDVYDFSNFDGDFEKSNVVNYINKTFEKYGVKDVLQVQDIEDVMNEYFYLNSSYDNETFLKYLINKKDITGNEYNYLESLNNQTLDAKNFDVDIIRGLITDFEKRVSSDSSLNSDEVEKLTNFSTMYKSMLTGISSSKEKGACIDCLAGEGVKITFWSSLVFAIVISFCLTQAVPSGGITLAPCLGITLGASILTAFAVCWRHCFGNTPYCPDPTCPSGFEFEASTAACCFPRTEGSGVVPSGNGSIFITVAENSEADCQEGWEWVSFLQVCTFELDASWENASLEDNQVCVSARCDK